MKLSLNWLKEFVNISETPEKLAERLTLAGIEVEHIEQLGGGLGGVIVGEIKTIIKHPAADKLSVTKVDIGKGAVLTIVCGASNIKVGQKVPVARVGVTLPGGVTIEKRPIRGVESEGMICAEDELGLGKDHEGILILDPAAKAGEKFIKAFGLHDVVFDLALTPQRADLFSIYGMAREVAALTGATLRDFTAKPLDSVKTSPHLSVRIEHPRRCPRYAAGLMTGIQHVQTPQYIKSRLIASGVRPISVVVDITNYVMLETGQPLHAFDRAKLATGKKAVLSVRQAKKGEKLATLDGKDRVLDSSMLVITDGSRPVALAGIMGGRDSEVTEHTKDIVIESAIFAPSDVRKASQRLGLRSEASLRFEKGIAWDLPPVALARAEELLHQSTGAKAAVNVLVSERDPKVRLIRTTVEEINGLLGSAIPEKKITQYLARLGIPSLREKRFLAITVPDWRHDITCSADIVEEVGRMHGFNSLVPTYFTSPSKPVQPSSLYRVSDNIKDILAASHFTEVLTYSYYGAAIMPSFHLARHDHFEVINPLNPGQQYMRMTLLPGVLEAAAKNSPLRETVDVFEVGQVFLRGHHHLPREDRMLALASLGRVSRFYHLKGVVSALLAQLGVHPSQASFHSASRVFADVAAEIKVGGKKIGFIAELRDDMLKSFKIRGEASCAELSVDVIASLAARPTFTRVPAFPSVVRDISMVIDPSVTYQSLIEAIRDIDPLVIDIIGFDLFPLQGKKSVGLRMVFQSQERTLTSHEVDVIMQRIEDRLRSRVSAVIRKAGETTSPVTQH